MLFNIPNAKAVNLSVSSNQNAVTLSENDRHELRSNFLEMGVDKSVIDLLIEKYEKTGFIDSIDNTKLPLFTEEENGYVRKVYEDGSVAEISHFLLQNPDSNPISLFSIEIGNWKSGSNWWTMTGGKAYYNTGIINCSFYFDASGSQGQSAIINSVYEPHVRLVGANVSEVNLQKVNSHHARLGFISNTNIGGVLPAGETCYLHLYVNGNANMHTQFTH
ncbi:MAG: hypothetical protein SPJ59_03465 [Peptoniphilaceae bacterium]|nr:hypothetical protein [Peptoniphilaceae bacterium]MDY5766619.1 hypothetical protein [Peptoniphilaceae bacterium]MDY5841974.1 hypothetical protein [Peptoniphilaceae bacterium]MDY6145945.1 hypothetical protein [Peptoniphilaceae bacterium]